MELGVSFRYYYQIKCFLASLSENDNQTHYKKHVFAYDYVSREIGQQSYVCM